MPQPHDHPPSLPPPPSSPQVVQKISTPSNSSSSSQSFRQLAMNSYQFPPLELLPYRSRLEIVSVASGNSRNSRDSDLLNKLAKDSSKSSSKSLSRRGYYQKNTGGLLSSNTLNNGSNGQGGGGSNSAASLRSGNSMQSEGQHSDHMEKQGNDSFNRMVDEGANSQGSHKGDSRKHINNQQSKHHHHTNVRSNLIEAAQITPRIHNCVCQVAGQCLKYNCNCFLSPYPCAPTCCSNCLSLKTNRPVRVNNICSCKKTRCLKLYCECLSRGDYCSVMCLCELCQNHSSSKARQITFPTKRGCNCGKSQCLKKYCSCYSAGIKCSPQCGCINCRNRDGDMELEDDGPDHDSNRKEPRFQPMDLLRLPMR